MSTTKETDFFQMPVEVKNRLIFLADEDSQHRANDGETLYFITSHKVTKSARDLERGYEGTWSTQYGIRPIHCEASRYPENGIRFASNYEHPAGYLITAGQLVGSLNVEAEDSKEFIKSLLDCRQIIEVGLLSYSGMYREFKLTGEGIDKIWGVDNFAMNRMVRKDDRGEGAQLPDDGAVFLSAKNFNKYLSTTPREVGGSMILSGSFLEPSTVAEMVADGWLIPAGEWKDGTLELVPSIRDEMRKLALIDYDQKISARKESK